MCSKFPEHVVCFGLVCIEMTSGISYHSRHSEVSGMHPLSEPVNFPPCVDENDCLRDGQGFIEVTQRVQLPFLSTTTRADAQKQSHFYLYTAFPVFPLPLLGEGYLQDNLFFLCSENMYFQRPVFWCFTLKLHVSSSFPRLVLCYKFLPFFLTLFTEVQKSLKEKKKKSINPQ